jgi:KDO2-lipid IV(A) lauroyltransferase
MEETEKNKHKSKEKNVFVIWAEFIPFLILYKFVRILPLKVAYFLSRQLFKILFLLDKRHRTRAIQHLIHAGVAKNHEEALGIAWQSYRHFSMLLVESFKMDQHLDVDKIPCKGSESAIRDVCDPILNEGNRNINVIIVTAHYGNWELAGPTWVKKFGIPMVSIMRPFANPLIGKYILRNRETGGHSCVPKSGGIRGMLKALRNGSTVAILADQHASRNEGVETVFFGQPCRTHASPAMLHLKTGVPIMPEITRRCGDNFDFEIVVGDLIRYTPTGDKDKDIQTVTQMYTTELEKLISEDPSQWLWAHRRWLNINRKHK